MSRMQRPPHQPNLTQSEKIKNTKAYEKLQATMDHCTYYVGRSIRDNVKKTEEAIREQRDEVANAPAMDVRHEIDYWCSQLQDSGATPQTVLYLRGELTHATFIGSTEAAVYSFENQYVTRIPTKRKLEAVAKTIQSIAKNHAHPIPRVKDMENNYNALLQNHSPEIQYAKSILQSPVTPNASQSELAEKKLENLKDEVNKYDFDADWTRFIICEPTKTQAQTRLEDLWQKQRPDIKALDEAWIWVFLAAGGTSVGITPIVGGVTGVAYGTCWAIDGIRYAFAKRKFNKKVEQVRKESRSELSQKLTSYTTLNDQLKAIGDFDLADTAIGIKKY